MRLPSLLSHQSTFAIPTTSKIYLIHDSLITTGLQLISGSYLDVMERRCQETGLPFERNVFDGRNFQVLVDDIQSGCLTFEYVYQGNGSTHLAPLSTRLNDVMGDPCFGSPAAYSFRYGW